MLCLSVSFLISCFGVVSFRKNETSRRAQ
jgi:Ring finger domain